ncbi:MAG TPA: hypothetical protein VEZ44_09245 [bacterium]|nr:hypothetical protein [bacterium]
MDREAAAQTAAWATRVLPVDAALAEYRAAVRAQLVAFRSGADDATRTARAQAVRTALGTLNRAIDQEMQAEQAEVAHGSS